MRRLTQIVLLACIALTGSCASPIPTSLAPQIEMPAEAARPCELYVLPPSPTQADLETGFTRRGAQLVACDAARRLAVQTHQAEHALEDQLRPPAAPRSSP